MDYALVLNLKKENKVNISWLTNILGKPMIEFVLDSLSKVNIKEILCLTEDKMELSTNKDIHALYKNKIHFYKDQFKENGCTVVIPENTYIRDETLLQDIMAYHKINKNDLTIATLEKKSLKQDDREWDIAYVNNDFLLQILSEDSKVNFPILKDLSNRKIEYYVIKDNKLLYIDNFYKLNQVESSLRKKINESHLSNNVYLENSDTITIGPEVILDPNCIIRSGSVILGKSKIHTGAIIGPNSEVIDSNIEENASVLHSVVKESFVGKNAKIGPFTHLRMNSRIGDNDRIGNFVEIKNSKIGEKTNISHLTYVGDTDCGRGVNFGCGVVTVNYDGKNKFRTTIGDNVFIGCNSNLIAPITLKNGSFIAAGSTITEDLDEDDFAIARCKQDTKKKYAKKYGYKKFKDTNE